MLCDVVVQTASKSWKTKTENTSSFDSTRAPERSAVPAAQPKVATTSSSPVIQSNGRRPVDTDSPLVDPVVQSKIPSGRPAHQQAVFNCYYYMFFYIHICSSSSE